MHCFYGNLRRIRNFPMGRCGHRPLQSNRKMPTNSPKDFRFSPLPAARPLRRSAPAPLRKGSLGVPPYGPPLRKGEVARRSRDGEVLQQAIADFVRLFGESAGTCAFGCRGRCPHRPGRMHRFYGNLRRIRNFPTGRCRHRPLQSNRKMPTDSPKDFRFSPLPTARPLRRSAPAPLRKGSLGAVQICRTVFAFSSPIRKSCYFAPKQV